MIERANADHPRTDGREWQASDILKNVVITVKHPEDEEHDEPWREVIVVGVPGEPYGGYEATGSPVRARRT